MFRFSVLGFSKQERKIWKSPKFSVFFRFLKLSQIFPENSFLKKVKILNNKTLNFGLFRVLDFVKTYNLKPNFC